MKRGTILSSCLCIAEKSFYRQKAFNLSSEGQKLHACKRKLINTDLVDDLFSSAISQTWERMEPIVKGNRERVKSSAVGEWFEFLYNEMKKREQKLQQSTAKGE